MACSVDADLLAMPLAKKLRETEKMAPCMTSKSPGVHSPEWHGCVQPRVRCQRPQQVQPALGLGPEVESEPGAAQGLLLAPLQTVQEMSC